MQYLFSKTGKLIEKVEESSVYLVKISLKKEAFDKFILRLPPSIKSCWIYGVFVEKKTTPVIVLKTLRKNEKMIEVIISFSFTSKPNFSVAETAKSQNIL